MKFIFITGGVTSSLGKGIVSASLGALLEARGFKVRLKKMDPYINVDPGTMSPYQHGEVFVTNDGAETDLDLGHYERFTTNLCTKDDSVSAGKIYHNVIEKERRGDYLGDTVQVIPHVTNEIKAFITQGVGNEDFLICEVGGTVGDIEATPFLEAIRQFVNDKSDSAIIIHLTLLPYLKTSEELKTKPTQHSVRELQSLGLKPSILLCRTSYLIADNDRRKISLFCNVSTEDVIPAYDCNNIYEVPLAYHKAGLDIRVLKHFNLPVKEINLQPWQNVEDIINNYQENVTIGFVGKYVEFKDAYKSIIEAFQHAGIHNKIQVNIKWIQSNDLTEDSNFEDIFSDISGILVGPGFGIRGIEGKIAAIKYVRENNIPFLGICFGMQLAVIEYARNILNIKDATSSEFEIPGTNVVGLITEWVKEDATIEVRDEYSLKGGTMRLGAYPCVIKPNTLLHKIYCTDLIYERHRHRYEINNNYKNDLENKGLIFSGTSPDSQLLETIENPNHRWFVGVQFHPELISKLFKPHPLFVSFVKECYYSKIKG